MVVNLLTTMNLKRFEVCVVSLYGSREDDLRQDLESAGIPVVFLDKRPGIDLRMIPRVDRVIREFHPDVVHTHLSVLRYCLPSILVRRVPAAVHTVHNVVEKEVDRPGRLVHFVAFRVGVKPVAIAEVVAQGLSKVYGVSDVPLIPNGVPVGVVRSLKEEDRRAWRRREGFAAEDVLFTCVARLSPQKNPVLLLEAFALAATGNPHARLVFAGSGELRPELERITQDLGICSQVRFLGLRRDVPEVLNASDVFVLSSDWEGNPLTVMEAMAAGKPVICTAVGGVPEIVEHGTTGLLVPAGDVSAFAEALTRLLTDVQLREALGSKAREVSDRFDVTRMTDAYERLYEAVLRPHRYH